jgi:hypothetical protein
VSVEGEVPMVQHDDAPEDEAGAAPVAPKGEHYDEKAWKKKYMKEYMRRRREKLRREKGDKGEGGGNGQKGEG